MERKRKLPPRAAARVEQAAKRRTSTPPADGNNTTRSATPALSGGGGDGSGGDDHAVKKEPALPKSIQAGKPLPTIEQAQPDDLPSADYQSVQESGVLAESLARSRQKWISEGIFEKYWSKPSKRRGVAVDDPKNPPKDSMVKLGQVVITVEPHMFEATMYGVKDPKPATVLPPPNVRPVIMYGPSRGAMPPPPLPPPTPQAPQAFRPVSVAATPPPPPKPKTLSQSPAPSPIPAAASGATPGASSTAVLPATPVQQPALPASTPQPAPLQPPRQLTPQSQPPQLQPPAPPAPPPPPSSSSSQAPSAAPPTPQQPAPAKSVLQPPRMLPQQTPPPLPTLPLQQQQPGQQMPIASPRPAPSPRGMEAILSPNAPAPHMRPPHPQPSPTMAPASARGPSASLPPSAAAMAGRPPSTTSGAAAPAYPQLRDLMKRVANGNAPKEELDRFQAIIDQITAERKRNGAAQGPDPLVVLLVKTALDDAKVRDMVRRIGENRPRFSDATDLKAVLDRLKHQQQAAAAAAAGAPPSAAAKTNGGVPNGNATLPAAGGQRATASPAPTTQSGRGHGSGQHHHHQGQQALRSKGPPPPPKVDVSAVVFEFAGGTGDRYLFPKFSILEQTTTPQGVPEVIASFLIVRKGSASEYGGDPDLDYYQPITVRLQVAPASHSLSSSFSLLSSSSSSANPKLLDYLARVVAPVDEVRRYMDNIMNNMTRAEYVLLAMRLPRKEVTNGGGGVASTGGKGTNKAEDNDDDDNNNSKMAVDKKGVNGHGGGEHTSYVVGRPEPMQGVLWTTPAAPAAPQQKALKRPVERDAYQDFIAGLVPKEVEDAA
ncbi:hypothetical protein SPI_05715 [Niveomyces insectorum RCEF 264]|uniref:SWR1-complex protein 3 domain-containing protein n=1 Tax=Niveomyces insectorum RCEF 264 TaxID=1081102 RepID=A0A167TGX5_9HYPO|nr:hypothetical protein SPI_05715 [Niveomyces insectorum RCEF 264]